MAINYLMIRSIKSLPFQRKLNEYIKPSYQDYQLDGRSSADLSPRQTFRTITTQYTSVDGRGTSSLWSGYEGHRNYDPVQKHRLQLPLTTANDGYITGGDKVQPPSRMPTYVSLVDPGSMIQEDRKTWIPALNAWITEVKATFLVS